MSAVIFSGAKVKSLKPEIQLGTGGASVVSRANVDPRSSAVDAAIGSILLDTTTGRMYKKLDSGSSTNWELLGVDANNLFEAPEIDPGLSFVSTYEDTHAQSGLSSGSWDTTNDNYPLTAHGFYTGEKVRYTNTITAAAPLVSGTDYYIIASSANEFQLATTRTNALGGVAINITAAGSGLDTITSTDFVNGTGGSPATLTVSRNTTTPLFGLGDLAIAKAATDGSGEGVSILTKSIPRAVQGRTLYFSMEWDGTHANYTSGNLSLRAYDVTNSAFLGVATISGAVTNSDGFPTLPNRKTKILISVYTVSTTAQIRISLHLGSDSATASTWTCYADRIVLREDATVPGAIVTEPVAYTPVFTGFGTVSAIEVYSYRDGSFLYIDGNFTSGTPTATEARMTLGFNGTSGNVTSAAIPSLRSAGEYFYGGSSSTHGGSVHVEPSVGYVTFGPIGTFSNSTIIATDKALGNAIGANGVKMSIRAKIPIAGWAASGAFSTTETLLQSAQFITSKDATQSIATVSATKVTWPATPLRDNLSGWNSGNNRYIIPRTGWYVGHAAVGTSNLSTESVIMEVRKNGSSYVDKREQPGGGNVGIVCPFSGYFTKGDYIEVFMSTTADAAYDLIAGSRSFFSITEIPDLTVFGVYGQAELISSTVLSGSAVSLVNGTEKTITSITVSPGEWDVTGMLAALISSTATRAIGLFSTTNNAAPGEPYTGGYAQITQPSGSISNQIMAIPTRTYVVSVPTTIYLIGQVNFTAGTASAYGHIQARRIK